MLCSSTVALMASAPSKHVSINMEDERRPLLEAQVTLMNVANSSTPTIEGEY